MGSASACQTAFLLPMTNHVETWHCACAFFNARVPVNVPTFYQPPVIIAMIAEDCAGRVVFVSASGECSSLSRITLVKTDMALLMWSSAIVAILTAGSKNGGVWARA